MFVGQQFVQTVGSQEDVGLPLQGLAERVAALGHHVVEDTAGGEDVHRAGLRKRERLCVRWL